MMKEVFFGVLILLLMQSVSAQQIALSGVVESSPNIADLNNNPTDGLEIIMGANNDYMHSIYSNVTKMLDWRINPSGSVYITGLSSPAIVDLNGDGSKEILVGGQQAVANSATQPGYVWAYYNSGAQWWRYSTGKTSIYSSPVVADLNGDGALEVLIGSNDPKLYALRADGNLYWSFTLGGSAASTAAVGDLNNDGTPEVVIVSNDGVVRILNGTGSQITSMQTGGIGVSSPALADLDNDGRPEIIIASADGMIYAWNGDGSSQAGWPVQAGVITTSSPAVGDLDRDGDLEVVVVTDENNVYAYHGDGIPFTGFPLTHQERLGFTSPALADLDGDGKLEIIMGTSYSFFNETTQVNTYGGKLYAWHLNGSMVGGYPKTTSHWIKSSPAVADIDGNGMNEVIVGSNDGNLYVFEATGSSDNLGWPRFHYDERNTRLYSAPTVSITSPLNGSYHKFGIPLTLTANANDVDGSIATYEWNSSLDGPIGSAASFSKNLSLGTHTINLKVRDSEGKVSRTKTVVMVVENLPPTATILSPANASTYSYSENITFSGQGLDDDGVVASYFWSSNRDGALGASGNITKTNLSLGEHTITLTVTDDNGATSSASIKVNIVNLAPTALILSPLNESSSTSGDALSFSGLGLDIDGSVVSYQWLSDKDGVLGSGSSITPSNLSLGVHWITFTVGDDLGASGNASIRLTINVRPPSGTGSNPDRTIIVQPPVYALLPPGVSNVVPTTYATTLLALVAEGKVSREAFVEAPGAVAASFLLTKRHLKPADHTAAQIAKNVQKISGDPYALAAAASEYSGFKTEPHANELVIARGDLEVDSMAAIAYAKAKNVPILLTKPGELPSETEKAITKLMGSGKRDIVVVGGPVAVAPSVEERLKAIGSVKRLYGGTRIETAAVVAEVAFPVKDDVKTIVITESARPAIDAAQLSFLLDAPLLYVKSDELSPMVRDYLSRHKSTSSGPTRVLFMGVSPRVASEIEKALK